MLAEKTLTSLRMLLYHMHALAEHVMKHLCVFVSVQFSGSCDHQGSLLCALYKSNLVVRPRSPAICIVRQNPQTI